MHPHLETLLEIQDLTTQRRDLAEAGADRDVQESVFGLSVEEALGQIDEKIKEMAESLPPQVRNRYQRLSTRNPRFVVSVIRGTCYGCFVQVPTALASDADRNEEIRSCQNCGRFLYLID
ncbi:C4-type zinc ribbon domain-containing protein [Longimicrobium sp.]|uniref:C4-type zinc ribbon domain-containing protein n=1 Tax=Longimicrobium sp. TaxID=2029185 RepID=UPI002E30EFC9|nr:C4-type zinc ribbon domain-containing protein [Longimicrobium sp.]HEX6037695.1 C4-type zinc ribbon domain-containing protein [Longimicrobium sp.]